MPPLFRCRHARRPCTHVAPPRQPKENREFVAAAIAAPERTGISSPAVVLGLGRLPFAVTALIAVLTGLPGPALSGGWTGRLPRVAAGERLPRANALDAMTFAEASLAGPVPAGDVGEVGCVDGRREVGWARRLVGSSARRLVGSAAPAAWTLPGLPAPVREPRRTSLIGALAAGMRSSSLWLCPLRPHRAGEIRKAARI
ncbi:hypothetical protein AB0L59_36475 [Streptomyces sp. NPDC052109]|uniref:hypothetical protein n=1 Tax=Streptomyces sp. NPDC052109 TaxID=3155527 RepID=UPI0034190E82